MFQMDGQFVLHNGYVARYRCPQRNVAVTKAPNKLVLQLQNFDVGCVQLFSAISSS